MKKSSLFVASSLAIAILTVGCQKKEEVQQEVGPRPVKMMVVGNSQSLSSKEFSGVVKSQHQATLSFELSGKLVKLPVKEGMFVKKGALIAQIDKREVLANLNSAQAKLNDARANYERNKALYKNNSISKKELDTSRKDYEMATAAVADAQKSVSDATITAPFSGTIAKKYVDNYESVNAKEPIAIIADNSALEISVSIPEQALVHTSPGKIKDEINSLDPKIEISAIPGKLFDAQFKEISSVADDITRTFTLTLTFDKSDKYTILPGMTANLILKGKKSIATDASTIEVPSEAIINRVEANSKDSVYVWKVNGGVAQFVPVKLGAFNDDNVAIDSGLTNGDTIAISGVHTLIEGTKVRPMVTKEN